GLGVPGHEVDYREGAFRVADDGRVIAQLEETKAPVLVLKRLKLEARAVLGRKRKALVAAVVFSHVPVEAGLMKFKQGVVPERPLSVRASCGIHLQYAEVDAHLKLLFPILALEPAGGHLPGL